MKSVWSSRKTSDQYFHEQAAQRASEEDQVPSPCIPQQERKREKTNSH